MVESTLYVCLSDNQCSWSSFQGSLSPDVKDFHVCPKCTGNLKVTDIKLDKVPNNINRNDLERLARKDELEERDFVATKVERRIEELKLEMPPDQAKKVAERLSNS